MTYLTASKQAEIAGRMGPADVRRHVKDTLLPELAKAIGAQVAHVPTAGEVSGGTFDVDLTFDPVSVIVQVRTTATGAPVDWDGNTTLTTGASPKVTIDNAGSVDWSVDDTVYIMASA